LVGTEKLDCVADPSPPPSPDINNSTQSRTEQKQAKIGLQKNMFNMNSSYIYTIQ
jgi:hypothetical protein